MVSGAGYAERLAEKSGRLGFQCISIVDETPVRLASEGVVVLLAQEANVIGVFELIEGGRIMLNFLSVELDGAGVLHSAVIELSSYLSRLIEVAILGAAIASMISMTTTKKSTPMSTKPSSEASAR